MSTVVKFPYIASLRVHSRKPRISKNGTPEERVAKAAADGINLSANKISVLSPKTPSKEITPSQGIEVPAKIRKAQLLEIQRLLIIIDDRRRLLKALTTLRAFAESRSDHPASLPGRLASTPCSNQIPMSRL
jgi:hypothetical protein